MHGKLSIGKLLRTIDWIVQELRCSRAGKANIQFIQINTNGPKKKVLNICCFQNGSLQASHIHYSAVSHLHVSINYRTKATLPNDLIGSIGFFSHSHTQTTIEIEQWIIIKSGEAQFHSISQLHFSLLHIHSLFLVNLSRPLALCNTMPYTRSQCVHCSISNDNNGLVLGSFVIYFMY